MTESEALKEIQESRARAEKAEAEVARLRAALAQATEDLKVARRLSEPTKDHACAECDPDGSLVDPSFTCWQHRKPDPDGVRAHAEWQAMRAVMDALDSEIVWSRPVGKAVLDAMRALDRVRAKEESTRGK